MWKLVERLSDGFKGRRIAISCNRVTNGATEMTMEVAEVQSAVAVLPVLKVGYDYFYILVKQHRFPIDPDGEVGPIIEACAGKIEEGQTPLEAAVAELKQETGYLAETWTYAGEFYSSPGITNEKIHCYFAEGLIAGKQELEVSERGLEVVRILRGKAISMVQKNEIKDQKTAVIVMAHAIRNLRWDDEAEDVPDYRDIPEDKN